MKVVMLRAALAGLLLVTGAGAARADDAEAMGLLRQAYERWNDPDPAECVALGERALAANPTSKQLRAQTLLFLGSVHQVRTGDVDRAIGYYDQVAGLLAGAPEPALRQLRADALCRKAALVYAERDDPQQALALYGEAQETQQLATTAENASQLAYRLGRLATGQADRERNLELALTLARESVELVPLQFAQDARRRAQFLAKCKLQVVIVLQGLGRAQEATALFGEIDGEQLTDNCLYQLALYHAQRGDLEEAARRLRRALELRPTPATRNQLRDYIRTEPDLQPGVSRDDWRDLVTDEPMGG